MKSQIIPIFFSVDDNYIPMLDVAICSLIKNASKEYKYVINILNTGLKEENTTKILKHNDDNFEIIFRDISEDVKPIKDELKNLYHFGLATYYRLFIEKLFPEYDKVLYLDCDIVVLGDISKLYNTFMGRNLIAGVTERIIYNNPVFSEYVKKAMGISPINYINAGILVMNLKEIRKAKIQDQFVYLINKYNFDVIDPDQAYLNFLCKGRIKYLPNGWNKEPLEEPAVGGLNIIHYALYKKPWQYADVLNGKYFWQYAKESLFYEEIKNIRDSFDDEKRNKKEQANVEIIVHARNIIKGHNTFKKLLLEKKENWIEELFGLTNANFNGSKVEV